jgi:hypothetical protein
MKEALPEMLEQKRMPDLIEKLKNEHKSILDILNGNREGETPCSKRFSDFALPAVF